MVLLVELVSVAPRPIAGWRDHHGFDCRRRLGESDQKLAARAEAEAKAAGLANERGVISLVSYSERRQGAIQE